MHAMVVPSETTCAVLISETILKILQCYFKKSLLVLQFDSTQWHRKISGYFDTRNNEFLLKIKN